MTGNLGPLVCTRHAQTIPRSLHGEVVFGLLGQLVHRGLELPLEILGGEPALEDVREGDEQGSDGVAELTVLAHRRAAQILQFFVV